LLSMGWLGFKAGSALAANSQAVTALVNTNTAGAAAALAWLFVSWFDEKPSVLGIVTGAVVGLAAVTPACGYVTPLAAMVIGATASLVSYGCIKLRKKWNLDESLDVWACHGMGGLVGVLATGLFATTLVNPAGANGLFYGNPGQFLLQAEAVVVCAVVAFAATFVIATVLKKTVGVRVSSDEEEVGLDISAHGEPAYS
jgi:ammonium transporter, Amt family